MEGSFDEDSGKDYEYVSRSKPQRDLKFKWTLEPIKLLIEEYKKRKYMFRMKGTKKKDLWLDILRVFYHAGYTSLSEEDLDRKFRNMKKTFVSIKSNSTLSYSKSNWEYYNDFEDIFEGVQLNRTTYIVQPICEATPPMEDPLSIYDERTIDCIQDNLKESHVQNTNLSRDVKNQKKHSATIHCTDYQEPPTSNKRCKKTKRLSVFKRKILELESLKIKEIKRLRITVEKTARERNKILSQLVTAIKYTGTASIPVIQHVLSDDL